MAEPPPRPDPRPGDIPEECAWEFRGYRLEAGQFATAMAHFYRGEISRSNVWRTRLDATTNWAVVTAGAALTFSFSDPQNPHFVLLLVFLLLLTFLYIEARRYQYYVVWAYRVHLMETDFFAAMLTPPFRPDADWADRMADSLRRPRFPIARWEAVGQRFRRNYVWLMSLLLVSWWIKLTLHPTPAPDVWTTVERAAFGALPGAWVVTAIGVIFGVLTAMSIAATARRRGRAELEERPTGFRRQVRRAVDTLAQGYQRKEQLATIITGCGQVVAQHILTELGRGVTAMSGVGMYTNEHKDVLLCAVTEAQVAHLERIVARADPSAFVVVSPAAEVRGWGFRSFQAPS